MPRQRNFKNARKSFVVDLEESQIEQEVLEKDSSEEFDTRGSYIEIASIFQRKEVIPRPFSNFIKIIVPQIIKFENKSKNDATKIAWHRWEVMNEKLKKPFKLMVIKTEKEEEPPVVKIDKTVDLTSKTEEVEQEMIRDKLFEDGRKKAGVEKQKPLEI